MKIVMVGSGYVGLVSGACFADFGHEVICVDKDRTKIDALERGVMPIFEPGLNALVANNVREPNAGFAVDTNHVVLVDADEEIDVPPAAKSEVAHRILDKMVGMLTPESQVPGTSRTARAPRRPPARAARRRSGR